MVLPLTGKAAIDGIRDQILQFPPARKKEGTKTGASDSAWLRIILNHANGDTKSVLIIGYDSDVDAAFKAWEIDAPRQIPLHQLESLLFVMDDAEDTVISKLVNFIIGSLPSDVPEVPLDERPLAVGRTPNLAAYLEGLDGMPSRMNISDADVMKLNSLLGLSDIRMDRAHSTISATLYLLAEVEYLGWYVDHDGRTVSESDSAGGFLIRDRLSFKWADNSIVRGATDDDNATVTQIDDTYYDPVDAANEFLETLSCVPGLDLSDELYEGSLPEEKSYTVNGRLMTLSTSADGEGGWEASIDVRNGEQASSIEITCEFDASANPVDRAPDIGRRIMQCRGGA